MGLLKNIVNQAIKDFDDIKTALIGNGASVEDDTPTSEYATKISDVYAHAEGAGYFVGEVEGRIMGVQEERDRFWDTYQDNGNRVSYNNAFAYNWTDEIFKPKYNIVLDGTYSADNMFFQTRIVDLVKCLDESGVTMDFSKSTRLNGTFDRSGYLVTIPPLDLSSCVSLDLAFYQTKITEIQLNNLRSDCAFDRAFHYTSSLEKLTINGTIGKDGFDIHWSTLLSADSLGSIINALSTSTTGLTVTLPSTARSNYDAVYGEGAWDALVASKSNWTIAYA